MNFCNLSPTEPSKGPSETFLPESMRWCSWEHVGPVCSEMGEGCMIWWMKMRFCPLLDIMKPLNSEFSEKDSLWAPENKGVLLPQKLLYVCLKTNKWENRPTKWKGKYPSWCFCSSNPSRDTWPLKSKILLD